MNEANVITSIRFTSKSKYFTVSKEKYNSVFHINNCINIYNYEKAYAIIKDNYREL